MSRDCFTVEDPSGTYQQETCVHTDSPKNDQLVVVTDSSSQYDDGFTSYSVDTHTVYKSDEDSFSQDHTYSVEYETPFYHNDSHGSDHYDQQLL